MRPEEKISQLREEAFDVTKTYPCPTLWCHISQKGLQGGAVLGTFAVAPAIAAWDTFKERKEVDPLRLLTGVAYTTLASLGLTALVGSVKLLQMDRAGMEDRVYRLHYNKAQHRVDHLAQAGAAIGLAAAAFLLRGNSDVKPLHLVGAGGVGTAAGVLLHLLTRPEEQRGNNKMFHELIN
eukprot:GHUV01000750.1.p1 GENE.GHUV01000750.1~~GHUV01000750.1.p1  ORF type:complete len:180 (+),score=54.44 GHUV01000750.1:127-666(+)